MAQSISRRIAGDRAVSGFFAFLASLPAIAGILAMGYLAYDLIVNQQSDLQEDSGYFWLVILAISAVLFFVLARWTFDGVRAALTPQRVQAMWLRRFQSERGGAFRTSRIIDQLSRHGVSALTLQDRDVQLSFEQRRNRLAPMFWLIFIPVTLLIAWLVYQGWQDALANLENQPRAENLRDAIGQAFGRVIGVFVILMVLVVAAFVGVLSSMAIIMLFAAIAGPIGAMFSRNRDDFEGLPKLLRRIQSGKGRRGASIVRISDEHWRAAVCSSLAAVDVAIIDLSDVSDHVAWEIGEAVKACGASGLVFIARGDSLAPGAGEAVRAAAGAEPRDIAFYPHNRGASGARFARELRQRIYAAADAKASR